MAADVGIEDLLTAHRGLSEIIHSFHADEGDDDGVGEVASVSLLGEGLNTTFSSQHVNEFLKDVSSLVDARKELAEMNEKINRATLNEKSATLLHPDILSGRITWCLEAEQHMRTIIENKDLLIYHLQQPLVANFLTMHYKYHKDLIVLVGELVDSLNNVASHIRMIEDHAQNSFLHRSDSYISSITKTVTDLRNTITDITALQGMVKGILETQE